MKGMAEISRFRRKRTSYQPWKRQLPFMLTQPRLRRHCARLDLRAQGAAMTCMSNVQSNHGDHTQRILVVPSTSVDEPREGSRAWIASSTPGSKAVAVVRRIPPWLTLRVCVMSKRAVRPSGRQVTMRLASRRGCFRRSCACCDCIVLLRVSLMCMREASIRICPPLQEICDEFTKGTGENRGIRGSTPLEDDRVIQPSLALCRRKAAVSAPLSQWNAGDMSQPP